MSVRASSPAPAALAPAETIGALTLPLEPIAASTKAVDAERLFVERPERGSLIVARDDGTFEILDRRRFAAQLAGRLGYGRSLHHRKGVQRLTAGAQTLTLPAATTLARAGSAALARAEDYRYLTAEGLPDLREALAERGRASGAATDASEIIVTSGAQQAIDLTARAAATWRGRGRRVADVHGHDAGPALFRGGLIGIPVDEHGLDVDCLEHCAGRHEVQLLALQPACQDPMGVDLSPERRARLAELAVERNLFVLEDAVYADLRYEGERVPSLRRDAPGHVIHVNSLSKVLGGACASGGSPRAGRCATASRCSSRGRTSILRRCSSTWPPATSRATPTTARSLAASVPYYRERRNALIGSLERHLAG